MEETTESPAVAEAPASVESAPVEAAEPVESAEPPAEEAPAEDPITSETFGWDDWDGKHESFPEDVRGWAEKINGHWNPKIKEHEEDAQRYQRLYEAMSYGQEDPRLEELKTTNTEWETKYTTLETELSGFKTSLEEYENQQVDEFVNKFYEQYGQELEQDESLKNAVTSLVEEDVDPYYAVQVAKMGEGAAALALELKKENVPDKRAMELISLKFSATNTPSAQPSVQPPLSKSQRAVTGATPAHRPQKPVVRMQDLDRREQLSRAAKIAIASNRKR
tara:strand:+ start:3142 stop:3975 length:834 start_codon:yes stop_codon:yes gene_type:complete